MTAPRAKAASARAAQAALYVGWAAATSAGSVPASRSARGSGSSGSRVGGGPPSRSRPEMLMCAECRMPAEPTGRLLPVHDTHLHVVERGPVDALPVLVLHGGPGLDSTMFGDYLDPLAEHYRLVFVDGRAQGRSDRDSDPHSWTLSQHASDVSAVAAALGVERYAVLGHSFGAFVALQHAADAPGAAVATIVSSGVPSSRFLDGIEASLESFEPTDLREQVKSSWEREPQVQTE